MNKAIGIGVVVAALAAVSLGMAYIQERGDREQIIINSVIGITARCADGMYSTAAKKQGQCAGHGGVAEWIIKGE